ncbi:hypothetical protein K2Q02_01455 [Patescibacteria group bacterium]|nr:hypothetical protein [Patescibacteria group bacterium]
MKSVQTTKQYSASTVPGYFTGNEHGVVLIRDEFRTNEHDELLWYFNDIYKLFLHHYAALGHEIEFSEGEEEKMTALLAELCKVKRMLNASLESL